MRANRPLMQKTQPCPSPGKEDSFRKTRLGRLKQKFKNLKRKMLKENQKTKLESNGYLKGQWCQQDLPRIVKRIVDKNPGITSIEISGTEIRWRSEMNYYDLFPKRKPIGDNPSKRTEEDK